MTSWKFSRLRIQFHAYSRRLGLYMFSWYKDLIVNLVFFPPRFMEWDSFQITPFPDRCLLVPFKHSLRIWWMFTCITYNTRYRGPVNFGILKSSLKPLIRKQSMIATDYDDFYTPVCNFSVKSHHCFIYDGTGWWERDAPFPDHCVLVPLFMAKTGLGTCKNGLSPPVIL